MAVDILAPCVTRALSAMVSSVNLPCHHEATSWYDYVFTPAGKAPSRLAREKGRHGRVAPTPARDESTQSSDESSSDVTNNDRAYDDASSSAGKRGTIIIYAWYTEFT